MARSPDLQPLLIKGGIVLVVLLAVGYAGKSWLDARALDERVAELVQEAADLREFENETSEARARLDEALDLDPNYWRAHLEMARLLRDLSRNTDAVVAYETARDKAEAQNVSEEQWAEIQYELGRCYYDMLLATGKKAYYNDASGALREARGDPRFKADALFWSATMELRARSLVGTELDSLKKALVDLETLQDEHPDYKKEKVPVLAERVRSMVAEVEKRNRERSGG